MLKIPALHAAGMLIVGLAVILSGCGERAPVDVEKPLRPVRTVTVSSPEATRLVEFTAVVDAARKADLSFKVSGELVRLLVKPGDQVVSGQLLAKLDDTDFRIQRDEAQSQFNKAKADFDRAQNLIRQQYISSADYDQLQSQYNSAKARLETASNNLRYTELYASFAGIIASKYTENFQEVSAKQPILALHDLSEVTLNINLPESVIIQFSGDRDEPDTSCIAVFDAIDARYPLRFKEISTQADEVTKTYEAVFSMPNPDDRLILPGMAARVICDKSHGVVTDNLFYLPPHSVLKDSSGHFVFIVEAVSEGVGQVKRTAVTVGELTPLGIEVLSGVSAGNQVITAGMSKVSDGMKVKI